MRGSVSCALIGLVWFVAPGIAAAGTQAADLDGLRQDWHRCVRQAFSGQPSSVAKQAAERAALAQCKASEDAYVAAELADRQADDEARRRNGRGLGLRAREWMASVAAYVVDPVTSWIGGIVR